MAKTTLQSDSPTIGIQTLNMAEINDTIKEAYQALEIGDVDLAKKIQESIIPFFQEGIIPGQTKDELSDYGRTNLAYHALTNEITEQMTKKYGAYGLGK